MLSRKDQMEEGTGRTGRGRLLLVQGSQSRPPALTSTVSTWLRPLASCGSLCRKHACVQDLSAPCVLCSLGWSVHCSSLCLKSFSQTGTKAGMPYALRQECVQGSRNNQEANVPGGSWWVLWLFLCVRWGAMNGLEQRTDLIGLVF